VLNRFSDLDIPQDSGDHALISKRVVREMREAPERNRFLRGIRAWVGYRQVALHVSRDARAAGATKYSFIKLLQLAASGIFSFSTAPLRISTYLGLIMVAAGVSFTVYATYVRLASSRPPEGFTALVYLLTIFSGVQLISLGVVGEYIGRIYQEVKHRKHYIVQAYWSSDAPSSSKVDT